MGVAFLLGGAKGLPSDGQTILHFHFIDPYLTGTCGKIGKSYAIRKVTPVYQATREIGWRWNGLPCQGHSIKLGEQRP